MTCLCFETEGVTLDINFWKLRKARQGLNVITDPHVLVTKITWNLRMNHLKYRWQCHSVSEFGFNLLVIV